jgi:hypothetical protein
MKKSVVKKFFTAVLAATLIVSLPSVGNGAIVHAEEVSATDPMQAELNDDESANGDASAPESSNETSNETEDTNDIENSSKENISSTSSFNPSDDSNSDVNSDSKQDIAKENTSSVSDDDISQSNQESADSSSEQTEKTSTAKSQVSGTGTVEENYEDKAESSSETSDIAAEDDASTEDALLIDSSTEDQDIAASNDSEESNIIYPAFQKTITLDDGVSVDIDAPEGAFPEGVDVDINKVTEDSTMSDVMTSVEEASGDKNLDDQDIVAYDFNFFTGEGREQANNIEPKTDISIKFRGVELGENNDGLTVYHVDKDNNASKVDNADVSVTDDTVEFTAKAFSIYALVARRAPKESAKEYYVSEDGDDQKDGLTIDNAFKTVAAALKKCSGGETIYIKGDVVCGSDNNWYNANAFSYSLTIKGYDSTDRSKNTIHLNGCGYGMFHPSGSTEGQNVKFENLVLDGDRDNDKKQGGYNLIMITTNAPVGNKKCSISMQNVEMKNYTGWAMIGAYDNNPAFDLTLDNCEIHDFITSYSGSRLDGAIYIDSKCSLEAKNTKFYNCDASYLHYHQGGAINVRKGASASFEYCEFYNNNAVLGGAICNRGTTTITNCKFNDNTAFWGGAIYNTSKAPLTISDSSIYENIAKSGNWDESYPGHGGGIYNYSGNVTINGGSIYSNHADIAADDIYNRTGATLTFPEVAKGVKLDGKTNKDSSGKWAAGDGCADNITGWYDDSADSRWNAHDLSAYHTKKVNSGETSGEASLKAAHESGCYQVKYALQNDEGSYGSVEDYKSLELASLGETITINHDNLDKKLSDQHYIFSHAEPGETLTVEKSYIGTDASEDQDNGVTTAVLYYDKSCPYKTAYYLEQTEGKGDYKLDSEGDLQWGKKGDNINATVKDFDGYKLNEQKSRISSTLELRNTEKNPLVLKLYYDINKNETNAFRVTYTDGVDNEEIFQTQTYTVNEGRDTPAFEGMPTREGYTFKGWSPEISSKVTEDITYTALWEKVKSDDSEASEKPSSHHHHHHSETSSDNSESGVSSTSAGTASSVNNTSSVTAVSPVIASSDNAQALGASHTNETSTTPASSTGKQSVANGNKAVSTGDDSHMGLWLMIMLAACAGLTGSIAYRKHSS